MKIEEEQLEMKKTIDRDNKKSEELSHRGEKN